MKTPGRWLKLETHHGRLQFSYIPFNLKLYPYLMMPFEMVPSSVLALISLVQPTTYVPSLFMCVEDWWCMCLFWYNRVWEGCCHSPQCHPISMLHNPWLKVCLVCLTLRTPNLSRSIFCNWQHCLPMQDCLSFLSTAQKLCHILANL
jgi:hypothetical protein